ncbi:molybdopterin converting factor subunit 1 [bacterium]|nr:molybdopterin converting factor subunit 1 [bacterium]
MIKVLFFARLREQLGTPECRVTWCDNMTVQSLMNYLLTNNDDKWQSLLAEEVVVAINQQVVNRDARIADGDELAFFPPVTGG